MTKIASITVQIDKSKDGNAVAHVLDMLADLNQKVNGAITVSDFKNAYHQAPTSTAVNTVMLPQEEWLDAYCDGGYRASEGIGAWAYCIVKQGIAIKARHQSLSNTTNNRAELMAVINLLSDCPVGSLLNIHCDSKYVIQSATEWMPNWKKNNWKTYTNQPVKNVDLMQELDELLSAHKIKFTWVKGHNGNQFNEHVDTLCNQAMDSHEF